MCATVDVSEVFTVPFVGRRILLHQTDGGAAVRLYVIRNGLSRGHVVTRDRHAEKASCCVMITGRVCLTV